MENAQSILSEIGAKHGLELELDENGACILELADGRVMLIQERAGLGELDFVATLGPVDEEIRADVFTDLLAANFYWNDTYGATLSWNTDMEEAVIIYPLGLADATVESVETVFTRFLELQSAWAERFAGIVAGAREGARDEAEDDDGEDLFVENEKETDSIITA